jgi:hypothetical protein
MTHSDLAIKLTTALLAAVAAFGASGCIAAAPEDLGGDDADPGSAAQALITSECLNYQRGVAGPAADAKLWASTPTYNTGSYTVLYTGTSSVGFKQTLLYFDISNVPADAHIDSATITLYESWKQTGSIVDVHEVLAPWSEGTVTWASFDGSFSPNASTSFYAWGGGGQLAFQVESLVQQWVNGDSENHGFLLQELNGATTYHSSEHELAASRPKLKVCYTVRP